MEEGQLAPNFSLKDKNEELHSLSDLKDNYTVIFFYPKDNTPGCTIETKSFNGNLEKFKELKTGVIGISGGDEKSKTKFCSKYDLDVTLLSDTDFTVSTSFGVYGEKSFMGRKYMGISRKTFILNNEHKIIKIFHKVKPMTHVKEVIEYIQQLN